MYERWEAKIVFRPDMMADAVYITRRIGDAREYVTGLNERVTCKQGEAPKEDPMFALLDQEQLQALTVALNDANYKAPDANLIEGKLTATERHLEDMRALVFKKRPGRE